MRAHNVNQRNRWTMGSFVMLVLFLVLDGPAAVAGQSITTQANGAFATAFVFNFPSNVSVGVSQNQSGGTPTTFLNYFVNTTGGLSFLIGFGSIPNSAFVVQGPAATLNVDTSTVALFTNESCTFDPSTQTTTCTPAPGGVINLKWTEIPQGFERSSTGTNSASFSGVTFNFVGTQNGADAQASGNVLGVTVTSDQGFSFANIGTNHQATIIITLQ